MKVLACGRAVEKSDLNFPVFFCFFLFSTLRLRIFLLSLKCYSRILLNYLGNKRCEILGDAWYIVRGYPVCRNLYITACLVGYPCLNELQIYKTRDSKTAQKIVEWQRESTIVTQDNSLLSFGKHTWSHIEAFIAFTALFFW